MALAKGSASVAVEVKKALNKRVVDLYRQFCRDTPRIIVMYNLEQTVAEVRHLLLLQFRKQGHAQDPRMIELLLQRGRMEHEETINQWKQKPHIMGILQPELAAPDVWLDREEFIRRYAARWRRSMSTCTNSRPR